MSGDIAILMTCHNRRDKTVLCLKALQRQDLPEGTRLSVYVVDDGSSDGTSDAIKSIFPSARLLSGDGSLFWCGGMRRAWQEAAKPDCQHYLWMNDDTSLFASAVADLLETLEYVRHQRGQDAIIVGAIRSPDSETATYGGVMRMKNRGSLGFNAMAPTGQPAECDTMNGNCVLVPRTIAEVVGNLSSQFTHGMGDFDYGLRRRRKGIAVG